MAKKCLMEKSARLWAEKAKDAKFNAEMAVKGKIRNGLKETTEQIQKAEGKLNQD